MKSTASSSEALSVGSLSLLLASPLGASSIELPQSLEGYEAWATAWREKGVSFESTLQQLAGELERAASATQMTNIPLLVLQRRVTAARGECRRWSLAKTKLIGKASNAIIKSLADHPSADSMLWETRRRLFCGLADASIAPPRIMEKLAALDAAHRKEHLGNMVKVMLAQARAEVPEYSSENPLAAWEVIRNALTAGDSLLLEAAFAFPTDILDIPEIGNEPEVVQLFLLATRILPEWNEYLTACGADLTYLESFADLAQSATLQNVKVNSALTLAIRLVADPANAKQTMREVAPLLQCQMNDGFDDNPLVRAVYALNDSPIFVIKSSVNSSDRPEKLDLVALLPPVNPPEALAQ